MCIGIRALLGLLGWVALKAMAISIVVTPGSTASYLYFPPASANSGSNTSGPSNSTLTLAGVGGVSLTKSGAYTAYSISQSSTGSVCGVGCTLAQFNTGAGFVTLTASRPSTFTDSSNVPLTNCTAVMSCTTWINTNANVALRVYPNCFEGDYRLNYSSTCTTALTPPGINQFYGVNMNAIGTFGGVYAGNLLVYQVTQALAAWESINDLYAQTYPLVSTGSSGIQNKTNILNVYTHGSIEDTCSGLGSGWYLPSVNELANFVSGLLLQYYWTSNDFSTNAAFAISPYGTPSFLPKTTSLGIACVRYYSIS
jgi:hypothetical protein